MKIDPNYYEPREVSIDNIEKSNFVSSELEDEDLLLMDAVKSNDKIVLLGNPGIGKTTELKKLFEYYWSEKQNLKLFPLYINIKNFREHYKIEDLVPTSEWIDLPRVIFIFDGLDEIANIQDFVSELELFIHRYISLNVKYVLSCRTNIFEKYLIKISGFKTYFLRNLTSAQIFRILEYKYGITFKELSIDTNKINFMQTPFFIEIFADYYKENNNFPQSDTAMWELYISKEIERQEKKIIKRKRIDVNALSILLKKVSLISELMQRNYLNELELSILLGVEKLNYIEQNPFGEILQVKNTNIKNYIFRHRNIQEYFAAKLLSLQDYKVIIDFIQIENTGKTHPSLFNTITFLLNIIDGVKRDSLFSWLLANEPEILFTADSDRISEIFKIRAFQNYFEEVCIKKTLWINNNRTFYTAKIGAFGDCKENFKYLLDLINDSKQTFRVILSALELLSYMTVPSSIRNNVKRDLRAKLESQNLVLIDDENHDDKIKCYILLCIYRFQFHNSDTEYIYSLIKILKSNDDREVNSYLLSLINVYDEVDNFFDYIYMEFLRTYKVIQRKKIYNFNTLNNEIENLVLKIQSPSHFLKIVKHFFDDGAENAEISYNSDFVSKIFRKCQDFCQNNPKFYRTLLLTIKKRKYWHFRENDLIAITIELGYQDIVVEMFLSEELPLDDTKYFIAKIINENNIVNIIDKFIDKNQTNEIEIFRNIVSNTNKYDLALAFEKYAVSRGVTFGEKLSTQEEIIANNLRSQGKFQNNFDLLFDKKSIISEIKKIYKELKVQKMNWEIVCSYPQHKNFQFHVNDAIALVILRGLIRDYHETDVKNIKSLLEDDYILMKEAMNIIISHGSTSPKFNISASQVMKIKDWTISSLEKIDFSKIIYVFPEDRYSVSHNFSICKVIFFFQDFFEIPIDRKYFLNFLEYCDFGNNTGKNQFNHFINQIGDLDLVKSTVIENLTKKQLHYFSLKNHISFSIEYKLESTYSKIEDYILSDNYLYGQDLILANYFAIDKNIDFLRRCCYNSNNGLCWYAVRILIDNVKEASDVEFIADVCIEHLNTKAEIYQADALSGLFKLNHDYAITYYFKLLKENDLSINSDSFAKYSNESGLRGLRDVFKIIYQNNESEPFYYHSAKSLFSTYINNLSKESASYEKVMSILSAIKRELIRTKSDLFYINILILDSQTSYINSKSKQLSISEASDKIASLVLF